MPEDSDDSWVEEGVDEARDNESFSEDGQAVQAPEVELPNASTKRGAKSSKHKFIMPSMDSSSIDGSWTNASGNFSPRRSPRRRKPPAEVLESRRRSPRLAARNERPQRQAVHRENPGPQPPNDAPRPWILVLATNVLTFMLDVVGKTLRILKTPLSFALAIWICYKALMVFQDSLTTSISSSLSPLCRIPGASTLNLPFCLPDTYNADTNAPPVEFDRLMTIQNKFEEILEESASSVSLPMHMKRSETSIRDLRQLVRYSELACKNELVLEFDGFVEAARTASYDLQKFNSHIGRAVDHVVSITRWTTRELEGIQMHEASEGIVSNVVQKLFAPLQPVKPTESALLDQYVKHTEVVEEQIRVLIDEAQALLMVLNSIDDRMDVIHGIIIRENVNTTSKHNETLSEFWSKIGGNKVKLSKTARELSLLDHVSRYRKTAYSHVSGTILKLQLIGAGLEDLRERVASPGLLRDRVNLPLSVHIENIQQGIARLEVGRQNARKLENAHIAKVLRGSD